MEEAVAMRRRVEVQLPGRSDSIIAGFRDDGRLCLYFGADLVYQFDAEGRLRRAVMGGHLYRTQGSTLAQLTRFRTDAVTELRRRDLAVDELAGFFQEMRMHVRSLRDALVHNSAHVARQCPADESIVPQLVQRLDEIASASGALAPAINLSR